LPSLFRCIVFFILESSIFFDSGAIAAAYGSVSAVTFVTAASLEIQHLKFSGHMVAVMALMEAPAIIVGVILIRMFDKKQESKTSSLIQHSLPTEVYLILEV
jgi:hypothetical protein